MKRTKLYSANAAATYLGLTARQMNYRVGKGDITPAKLREGANQAHLYVFGEDQLADMKVQGTTQLPPPDVVDAEYIMDLTGIDKSTISYHIAEGHLTVHKVGRWRVFWRDEANRFLADWQPQGRGDSSD